MNLSFVGKLGDLMDYLEEQTFFCKVCKDTGVVEKMGDGANFEWDVVGYERCKCVD